MPLNYNDGIGGKKGVKHDCPKRVGRNYNWTCKCKQQVYRSAFLTYKSGRKKIMNYNGGVGGGKDEMHICPNWLQKQPPMKSNKEPDYMAKFLNDVVIWDNDSPEVRGSKMRLQEKMRR